MGFFLSLPVWVFTALVTLSFNLFAAAGLTAFLRLWPAERRFAHNDIAGYISAIVGIVYGVLIASIAVVVLENSDAARNAVDLEAGLMVNVFADAKSLSAPTWTSMRSNLFAYSESVIDAEWPDMRRGDTPSAGRRYLYGMRAALAGFAPQDRREQVYLEETLKSLNDLVLARRSRVYTAQHYVSPMIWRFLITSSIVTLLMTFVFGVKQYWAHLAMCCLLASTMGFVFSLIIVVDDPFLWQSGIGQAPFVEALTIMHQLDGSGPSLAEVTR